MPSIIGPAEGKLGVLMPGLGAVATTFIAGVEAIRKNLAEPIGSLTQMGTIRIGKRTEDQCPRIRDFVPLAELDDIVEAGTSTGTTCSRRRATPGCSSRRRCRQ